MSDWWSLYQRVCWRRAHRHLVRAYHDGLGDEVVACQTVLTVGADDEHAERGDGQKRE